MKLITRAERIGLTWQGTTRRPDQYCNNPKHNRTTNTVQVLKNQLQMHGYSYIFLILDALERSLREIACGTCGLI